jgi:anti-sigma regulatory factor (Ser/Thr protein kinase)
MKSREISGEANRIVFGGGLLPQDVLQFSKVLNVVITKKGYQDVILDFSQSFPVREGFMVPAIALIRRYRRDGASFTLNKPENAAGKSIFHNANWAHLIDDVENAPTTYEGDGHLPASVYKTSAEQTIAVDRLVAMVMRAVPLQRKQIAALEWSVSEVTDNVLNHSESALGGIMQASTITSGGRQMVEFVVADTGIGIKKSLNETQEARALERAIQEGVTRNPATNQGNGLYGTFRVSTLSEGKFELLSGRTTLWAEGEARVHTNVRTDAFYPGTVVVCRIGVDNEQLIENALMFKGKVHEPGFDYIEKRFESSYGDEFVFNMKSEITSYGSREAGVAARTMIENLCAQTLTTP